MTTQQIIDEQMKEFDKSIFHGPDFLNNFAHKLIEAVGEEIIGSNQQIVMGNSYTNIQTEANNDFRDKQRLKLKEIINSLK